MRHDDPAFEARLLNEHGWGEAQTSYDEEFANELHAHLEAAFPGRVQYALTRLRDDPQSASVHETAIDAAEMDALPERVASAAKEAALRQVQGRGFDSAEAVWSVRYEHATVGIQRDGSVGDLGLHASATVLVVDEAIDPECL